MAIDPEELEPRTKAPKPRNLETMSIEELKAYVDELKAEIDRVRQAIAGKEAARHGAESVFRK